LTMLEDSSLVSRHGLAEATQPESHRTSNVSSSLVTLRTAGSSDESFLYQTFASTRSDEMRLTGWNQEQQEAFLRMQYEAQRRSYLLQCPEAEYRVICCDEIAVGRLIVDRTVEEIHVMDIALLPEFRKLGIGSTLMQAIMKEASQAAKAVRLHVEHFNPALAWYERLGFSEVNRGPIYREMVWRPGLQAPGSGEKPAAEPEPGVGGACGDLSH
ncbi:MAG: N-acetyltransferase, partial [Candidatus Sulfotelmatobacter sp.]